LGVTNVFQIIWDVITTLCVRFILLLCFLLIFLSHGQNQILTVKIKSNSILLHLSFSFLYSLLHGFAGGAARSTLGGLAAGALAPDLRQCDGDSSSGSAIASAARRILGVRP
jgi:hypothetical protein